MVQEQWLHLKMTFLLGCDLKIVIQCGGEGGGMGHFFLKNWNNNIYFRTLDLYLAAKNLLYGFSLLIKEATNLCNKPRLNSVNQNQCINTTSQCSRFIYSSLQEIQLKCRSRRRARIINISFKPKQQALDTETAAILKLCLIIDFFSYQLSAQQIY